MMRVKVDEDLPKAAVQMLRNRGYEVASVVDQGLGGLKDPPLWQAIQAEQRFLVTADKGFGDRRFVTSPGQRSSARSRSYRARCSTRYVGTGTSHQPTAGLPDSG